jgi:hypothetical protein
MLGHPHGFQHRHEDLSKMKSPRRAPLALLLAITALACSLPVSGQYPSPPEPNYGPAKGSLEFQDLDPSAAIGGTLVMGRALDGNGQRVDEAAAGITAYMVHWGLEVGEPGVADDAGNGDLGGDCKGFRDTTNIGMVPTSDPAPTLRMEIPMGTAVPDAAVYFVGHAIYGPIHNLNKCIQIPIVNWIEEPGD